VLRGPLAPFLCEEFHLTDTQQGLLVAVPLLGGSLFRPLLGVLGDRIGGRRAGLIGLALTITPLLLGCKVAHTLGHFYAVGLLLGIAGARFAVALPLASGWYPPEYQGLAMGIAGAGNSGSLLATLAAPRLAQRFGWASTFGLMILPVLRSSSCLRFSRKTARVLGRGRRGETMLIVLKEPDTLWFLCLHSLTFGGFVGFTSFLTTFFHDLVPQRTRPCSQGHEERQEHRHHRPEAYASPAATSTPTTRMMISHTRGIGFRAAARCPVAFLPAGPELGAAFGLHEPDASVVPSPRRLLMNWRL
jgi:nitrate/nitrite transporter NarK